MHGQKKPVHRQDSVLFRNDGMEVVDPTGPLVDVHGVMQMVSMLSHSRYPLWRGPS